MSGPEELRALVEALKDTLASLVAATSLLKRGSKKAAPSDTMFDMMVADYEKSIDRARTALTRAESSLASPAGMEGWMPTHRHKKRGTQYEVIGIGKMQAEHWIDQRWTRQPESGEPPKPSWSRVDLREVVVYRSLDDGSLWVRPREEFEDGRFEALRSLEGRDE